MQGWMDGVEFNAPLDTVEVISEAVFTANHLTDTDKQNSTGKYCGPAFLAHPVFEKSIVGKEILVAKPASQRQY